mmetsp:Transcript_90100/g.142367  ORF Transcript_90100/g.142367 Transcript_90100/m.142367 type:complete len:122 (-) Transcript_90100:19-384(-)
MTLKSKTLQSIARKMHPPMHLLILAMLQSMHRAFRNSQRWSGIRLATRLQGLPNLCQCYLPSRRDNVKKYGVFSTAGYKGFNAIVRLRPVWTSLLGVSHCCGDCGLSNIAAASPWCFAEGS